MASAPDAAAPVYRSNAQAFVAALRHAWISVFFPVLGGTYVGIGALAHDYGFSIWWLTASTLIIWAGPAQLILITALGSGAALIEAAVAVWLSGVRLFPMVVALLPLLRDEKRRIAPLVLPAHFTSVSMWVESMRVLPGMSRDRRIAYCNGLSIGYLATAVVFGVAGFFLAARLPPLFAAMLLFLTPIAFLITTVRGSRALIEKLAFVLGLVIGPVLAYLEVELDLLWTGIAGGLIAYGVHRVRGGMT
ncbi:MAG: AzlC family ABC transporter permease [Pseudolabrys sp.]